jgi:hypothetical protein
VPKLEALKEAAHSLGLPIEEKPGALAVFLAGRKHLSITEEEGQSIAVVRYGAIPESVFWVLAVGAVCFATVGVFSTPRFAGMSLFGLALTLFMAVTTARDYRTTRRWKDKLFQRADEMSPRAR